MSRTEGMERAPGRLRTGLGALGALVVLFPAGGSAMTEECPEPPRLDLSQVDPKDDTLPYRYPLGIVEGQTRQADFCEHRGSPGDMFHAAEDFWRPAGTEVYAMADGEVSFSGKMGGYGWLVIIDHPEMNIHSLYGHLSPSRWRAAPGPVAKGDLIGYLGDEWENGGSRDEPLVAHLHLGVREGQRTDYPGRGEWRWMAGWIESCPTELGWLQPSAVIAGQTFPDGGFDGPSGFRPGMWWTEAILIGAMSLGAAWWIIVGIRKHMPFLPLGMSVVFAALAWYLSVRGFILVAPIYLAASAGLVAGMLLLLRRPSEERLG